MDTLARIPSSIIFRPAPRLLFAVALAALLLPWRLVAQSAPLDLAAQTPAEDLAAARKDMASVPPAGLAARLDDMALSLSPSDAVILIGENADRVPEPAARGYLFEQAADLDLLLGRFDGAAAFYLRASAQHPEGDPATLLRAARCEIAAGENVRARELASTVRRTARDASVSARARLVDAWALFFMGRADEANAAAGEVASEVTSAPERKEARFLAWASSEPAGKAAAADRLGKEFPQSPEALIAAGTLPLAPLPHWYLGRSFPEGVAPGSSTPASAPASIAATAPESSPGVVPSVPSTPASGGEAGTVPGPSAHSDSRLQVGYFSVEANARSLAAELAAKGFRAAIEAKKPSSGAAEGTRWIVYVDGGRDPDGARLRLKDAGYESYLME